MPFTSILKSAFVGGLAAVMVGCASTRYIAIQAAPNDSTVTVDEQVMPAPGFEAPTAGLPRTYRVKIQHDKYKTFVTTLSNQLDGAVAARNVALALGTGGLLAVPYALWPRLETEPFFLVGLAVAVAGGGLGVANSFAFQESYDFKLVAEAPTPLQANDLAPDELVEPPLAARPRPQAAAVVIGVERYNDRVPGVRFARRDALAFRNYLERSVGVPPERIITLLDEQATAAGIRTALEGRLRDIVGNEPAEVYFYFAGHGAPDLESHLPYLVPFDGHPDYAVTSCYPLGSAYHAIEQIKARSVTVVLDSCFSGSAGRTEKATSLFKDARPIHVTPKGIKLPRHTLVFAATQPSQISSGYEPKQHGLFTYFLLKGMRGDADANHDGQITAAELQAYTRHEVERTARAVYGRDQHPVMLGDEPGRVLVAY